jgi:hypothetical protein
MAQNALSESDVAIRHLELFVLDRVCSKRLRRRMPSGEYRQRAGGHKRRRSGSFALGNDDAVAALAIVFIVVVVLVQVKLALSQPAQETV